MQKFIALGATFFLAAVAFIVVAISSGGALAQGSVPPVTNIAVCSGPNSGEVIISWDSISQATYYRIGYVNMVTDYPRAKASTTGEWIEAFVYVDVNARNIPATTGRGQYTLRRLVQGDRHAFTVLTSNNVVNTVETISGEYSWPQNPRWAFHTVTNPDPDCTAASPVPATTPQSTTTPTPAPTLTPTRASVAAGDYDSDNDGLIEVSNLAQLNAIRYDLDGDGMTILPGSRRAAFPNARSDMGCPAGGCVGYELVANLNLDTSGNGRADETDDYWNGGTGWTPIGNNEDPYLATFEGNGHTISNLHIERNTGFLGLFGKVDADGIIRNAGIVDGTVSGRGSVGALVGYNRGTIVNSYATADVSGSGNVGGLVGWNYQGTITDSYATGNVTGLTDGGQLTISYFNFGGLVGWNYQGDITDSYATGNVYGEAHVGGLVGSNHQGTITDSYATGNVTGQVDLGCLVGVNASGGTITGSSGTCTLSYVY